MKIRQPFTLLIVDDHILYRDGLWELISHWSEFQIIGLVGNGYEALEIYREQQPDLVLMDVHMPVMDGLEATSRILREFPRARIVMMTVTNDDSLLLRAIQSGACGYMLKEASSQQLRHLLMGWVSNEKDQMGQEFLK